VLTAEKEVADYFEQAAVLAGDPKTAANWVMREVLGYLKTEGIAISGLKVTPGALAELIALVESGRVSSRAAKDVFASMCENGAGAEESLAMLGLEQISDSGAIDAAVREVIDGFPDEVERLRGGEEKLLDYLVGQVMKKTKGKANPKMVNEMMKKMISE
jgi:aspartyl-tRNA(Asn)/glutamyl-tRNA(Gln) amidotransferase subunit B